MADKIAALKAEAQELIAKRTATNTPIHDTNLAAVCQDIPQLSRVNLRPVRILKGHLAKIYSLHWSEDSQHIVSASQDGKLIVWDAYSANKVHAIPLTSSWVMTVAYAPSGNFVACGGLDNNCSIYNLRAQQGSFKAHRVLKGHTGYLSCCRFLSDSEMLTSSGDSTCGLWDIESEQCKRRFNGHLADVMSISRSEKDPNLFVSGACDNLVKIWDIRTEKSVQTFFGHTGDVNSVVWHPSHLALASGSDDGTCRIFDTRADCEIANLNTGEEIGITSIAFSKGGRLLFSGCDGNMVRVWDAVKGEDRGHLEGHDNRVSCLGVSKDGNALCTGSWDAILRVWT